MPYKVFQVIIYSDNDLTSRILEEAKKLSLNVTVQNVGPLGNDYNIHFLYDDIDESAITLCIKKVCHEENTWAVIKYFDDKKQFRVYCRCGSSKRYLMYKKSVLRDIKEQLLLFKGDVPLDSWLQDFFGNMPTDDEDEEYFAQGGCWKSSDV